MAKTAKTKSKGGGKTPPRFGSPEWRKKHGMPVANKKGSKSKSRR